MSAGVMATMRHAHDLQNKKEKQIKNEYQKKEKKKEKETGSDK